MENTSSAYISLKAELLRKKQDLQKISSSSSSSPSSSMILDNLQSSSSSLKLKSNADLDIEISNPSKKKKKFDSKNLPSPPPVSTSANLSREDEIAFAKSRAILEAKSKLYDEIMSNSEMKSLADDDGNEDNDKSFLVNFERKIYETNTINAKMEYIDSFGRTRLVTPEAYEQLRASERRQPVEQISPKLTENEIERVERLHREQMRSKWEAEMEELRNKTHVHYQDVLFDEKREHGVGFYQFSTDDKQRTEQMATLNELRSNTKVEQVKFHDNQDKRQSIMAERLNKIRLRKAKEMGIHLENNNETQQIPSPRDTDQSAVNLKELPIIVQEIPLANTKNDAIEPKIPDCSDVAKRSSEQIAHTTRIQPPPSHQSTTQNAANSNSAFAYPFPVMRAVKTADTNKNSTLS